jgi:hypothetical protein
VSPNEFRRIALGMTGAVEGSHMAHPDFRANGKIFATLYPDNKAGMVKLTPEQQQEFLRANPGMFAPAAGAWGRQGCTTVNLAAADEATIGEAMTLAWQATTTQPARKRGTTPFRSAPSAKRGRTPFPTYTARRRKKA